MRRYFAIFFLFLFILYHAGYISVYWVATHQIDEYWNNKESFGDNLQKVSVPITLPYRADQQEYIPSGGSFQMDGKVYRAVLQKYANDSLHLLVVEDILTAHLHQSIKDWSNNASNATDQSNKTNYLKSVSKDYRQTESFSRLMKRDFNYIPQYLTAYSFSIISFVPEIDPLPPQV